jgi:sugar phosphate isomerase/epimerase
VHAKDVYVDPHNTARNGVLDTKRYERFGERSWSFRSVGYGQGEKFWRDFVSALRIAGYDGVLSIEHEDGLASVEEGLSRAVEVLRAVVLREAPSEMWWA